MGLKRAWHSLRLMTILNSKKRGDYVRKHKLFQYCGNDVRLPHMILPLYSKCISIHNNVEVATGVLFVTHDAIHTVLNHMENDSLFSEKIGCIEILDNVFIGANTIILGNVRIGKNVIIGANSLVNKDIPDNSVAFGSPAKVVCSFEDFVSKRKAINKKDINSLWKEFGERRDEKVY